MFPMMVLGLLYRNIGRKKATEMMFLGERVTAVQAQEVEAEPAAPKGQGAEFLVEGAQSRVLGVGSLAPCPPLNPFRVQGDGLDRIPTREALARKQVSVWVVGNGCSSGGDMNVSQLVICGRVTCNAAPGPSCTTS